MSFFMFEIFFSFIVVCIHLWCYRTSDAHIITYSKIHMITNHLYSYKYVLNDMGIYFPKENKTLCIFVKLCK